MVKKRAAREDTIGGARDEQNDKGKGGKDQGKGGETQGKDGRGHGKGGMIDGEIGRAI